MPLPLSQPPKTLCLLRLSAVGDISHTLPVVRTIQEYWPETKVTWVIGKLEHSLVGDIPGVEFIIFDKAKRWAAFGELRRALAGRRFDVLVHMQMSLRASLASLLIRAGIRLGFDKTRAKDMQWLFTNARIPFKPRQHVVDSFFGFTETLGLPQHILRWDIPIPPQARQFAAEILPENEPALVISPCSSMDYRNWTAERYSAVADYNHPHAQPAPQPHRPDQPQGTAGPAGARQGAAGARFGPGPSGHGGGHPRDRPVRGDQP
jgi:heptosyltransferase I